MAIRKFKNFSPDIHKNAYIDDSAIVIGNVTIDEESSVWPKTVIRGDVQQVRIGARTNIQDGRRHIIKAFGLEATRSYIFCEG